MAEIYREYKDNRININNKKKPYVFSDIYKKEHTPVIIYEGGDYLKMFGNWSIYDKLQIQNNIIKYTYCEIREGNAILITGSLLLGTIYSIIIMIGKIFEALNIKSEIKICLTIKANEKMIFRMQKRVMDIVDYFLETYYLDKDKEHKVEYCFNSVNETEINRFTNRILELFASENPKSDIPFLSATIDETTKFCGLLLTYENYLVIEN